jgi:hypothetical protein
MVVEYNDLFLFDESVIPDDAEVYVFPNYKYTHVSEIEYIDFMWDAWIYYGG